MKSQVLEWSEELATGLDIVDNQHKGLINFINDLTNNIDLDHKKELKYFNSVKDEITNYIIEHFSTEENIMELNNINKRFLDQHRYEHSTFIKKIGGIIETSEINFSLDDVVFFLIEWVINHINQTDKNSLNKGMIT